jgi:MFS family permease
MNLVARQLGRAAAARRALPRNVRALGWVSFANDLASELAYPIVPLFLTVTLGAPVAALGVIEGIAEGAAVGLRGLSGWLSDRWAERRKPWIVAGYGLSALARPLLAGAPSWGVVLGARLFDRFGKAARTAPRDALIRDSTPPTLLGASFGYHRALDTAGAVAGPLLAFAALSGGVSLRGTLWLAAALGFATLLLLRTVTEAPLRPQRAASERVGLAELPRAFWIVLGIWVVFSIGNSSDAFLLLRSHDLGLGPALVILAYALYNAVYAALSWPLGALSDRFPREVLLAFGLTVFCLVYAGFALVHVDWAVWPLWILYGAYIAATEGVARAWVADQIPGHAAGTAYGIFAGATGASVLVASIVAGLLWSYVSPAAPFVLGAASAAVALLAIVATVATSRNAPSRL